MASVTLPSFFAENAIPTVNFTEDAGRWILDLETPNFAHSILGHAHTFSALPVIIFRKSLFSALPNLHPCRIGPIPHGHTRDVNTSGLRTIDVEGCLISSWTLWPPAVCFVHYVNVGSESSPNSKLTKSSPPAIAMRGKLLQLSTGVRLELKNPSSTDL